MARRVDIRLKILEAATRLIGERGYSSTPLRVIADAVGIRDASLLYHFRSKEILRDAVVEHILLHWKDELPRLLAAASSGHDRFASTVSALVAFFGEDRLRAKFALREFLDRPKVIGELLGRHLHPWVQLVVQYIHQGQKSGVVRDDVDPEAYVLQVVMMVLSTVALGPVAANLFGEEHRRSNEEMIAELVRLTRNGLFVDPSPT